MKGELCDLNLLDMKTKLNCLFDRVELCSVKLNAAVLGEGMKLGTLYPDMIMWKPVINISNEQGFEFVNFWRDILPGEDPFDMELYPGKHFPKGSTIQANLLTKESYYMSNITCEGYDVTFERLIGHSGPGALYLINIYSVNKSPQEINITIDEYIKYEDIGQPYPYVITINGETGYAKEYRVGDTVTFDCLNLFPELYNGQGFTLNGEEIAFPKNMVISSNMNFALTKREYLKGNNAPKCILSPSRLRMPNSSYKHYGYIPDLTGNGNHGQVKNSAYSHMGGVNGYSMDFARDYYRCYDTLKITDATIRVVGSNLNETNVLPGYIVYYYKALEPVDIKVSNLKPGSYFEYIYTARYGERHTVTIADNGIYSLPYSYYAPSGSDIPNGLRSDVDIEGVFIEQIGKYEGSFCFDGVEDIAIFPTLNYGGKQVLIKTNWWLNMYTFIYSQDTEMYPKFAIKLESAKDIAYSTGNYDSITYIDGILNNNILVGDLARITHNITACNKADVDEGTPSVGGRFYPEIPAVGGCTAMALYDFMLFDEIDSEETIKELNDIIGIEGNYVEKPEWYWDAYGKTNRDSDRNIIMDQVSKDEANALEARDFDWNDKSGYINNGMILRGMFEKLSNDDIPAFIDFTVIAKRQRNNNKDSDAFAIKGYYLSNGNANAFVLDQYTVANGINNISFGEKNPVTETSLITYMTPTECDGKTINRGTANDYKGFTIGRGSNGWNGMFWKLMLWSKTINKLSINMIRNMFEKDEIIDLTNPVFKK